MTKRQQKRWKHVFPALLQVVEYNHSEIQAAQDRGSSISPMFAAGRKAKQLPWLSGDGPKAARMLDPIVLAYALTLSWFDPEHGDPWDVAFAQVDARFEFIRSWDATRYAAGETPLSKAIALAKEFPLLPLRDDSRKYCEFTSICGHLQRQTAGPIFIAEETFAEILGLSHQNISNYRKRAVADGLLVQVAPHNHLQGRSTSFTFQLDRFDWVTGLEVDRIPPKPTPIHAPLAIGLNRTTQGQIKD